MNSALSEEQEELGQLVRTFLRDKSPESEVRRLMETDEGYDPAVWRQMAEQVGLQGLIIPEEFGGSGFGFLELAVVLKEMGAALLCAPYFSTVALTATALLHSSDAAAKKQHLPGIATGETIATTALIEESWRRETTGVAATAVADGEGHLLSGAKDYVLDGHVADLLLVPALTGSSVSLFAVHGAAPGISRQALSTMDQTRKLARVELHDTPGQLVGREGAGWEIIDRALDLGAVALAAEQVGGAQRCMEMSVTYVQERVQFGRPVGSFQAVKHKCADMLVAVEQAESAADYAACCASELDDDLPVAACMAKACCSDAYFEVAQETIQTHGGIGFTWEHPAHLYFKRAKSSQILLGDPAQHRALLADRLGL